MEFDFWVWLNEQKEHLAIIASVLGSVWAIHKFLGKHIKECFSRIIYMFNAKAAAQETNTKLDNIMLQLVPNGGSSIKDSLNRIEDKQHFLGSFLKTQLNTHAKALFEANADGECTWVNRTHSRMTGFQNAEVMGHGWANVIAPECRTNFKRLWELNVATGAEFDEDVWYIKPDGRTRYKVHVHAYIIQNRDGGPAGYLGEVTELGPESTEPVDCAH